MMCSLASLLFFVILAVKCWSETPVTRLFTEPDENVSLGYSGSSFAVIGTVGGLIHGIDRNTHEKLWTFSTGGPLISSHECSVNRRAYSVVPLLDGSLVYRGNRGLRTTSIHARVLAENTPFRTHDGLYYTGEKLSRLLEIDMRTGELIAEFGANQMMRKNSSENSLVIGRNDYVIKAYDDVTGVQEFNLTYGELFPLIDATRTVHPSDARSDKDSSVVCTPAGEVAFASKNGFVSVPFQLDSPATFAFSVKMPEPTVTPKLFLTGDQRIQHSNTPNTTHNTTVSRTQTSDPISTRGGDMASKVGMRMRSSESEENTCSLPSVVQTLDILYGTALPTSQAERCPNSDGTARNSVAVVRATPRKTRESNESMALASLFTPPLDVRTDDLTGDMLLFQRTPLGGEYGMYIHPSQLRSQKQIGRFDSRPINSVTIDSTRCLYNEEFCAVAYPDGNTSKSYGEREKGRSNGHSIGNMSRRVHMLGDRYRRQTNEGKGYLMLPLPPSHDDTPADLSVYDLARELFGFSSNSNKPVVAILNQLALACLWLILSMMYTVTTGFGMLAAICMLGYGTMFVLHRQYALAVLRRVSSLLSTIHDTRTESATLSPSDQGVRSKVGGLEIHHDKELGTGSNGTVVLRGVLEGKRHVAVKRMLSRFQRAVDREVSLLSAVDGHPNVVRYFQSFQDGAFHLLVLELCDMSLWQYIMEKSTFRGTADGHVTRDVDEVEQTEEVVMYSPNREDVRNALWQVANGVAHLHAKSIVHRDIKPHNILLRRKNASDLYLPQGDSVKVCDEADNDDMLGAFDLKISDMGLSKAVVGGEYASSSTVYSDISKPSSYRSSAAHLGGTIGWGAPELFSRRKDSDACPSSSDEDADAKPYKSDIFSLGCVFHFVMVPGHHPYGECHERVINIIQGRSDLSHILKNSVEAHDLLSRMIHENPNRRPSAQQVCAHPYFWSPIQRLDFLNDFSQRVQQSIKNKSADMLHRIVDNAKDCNGDGIVGSSWASVLDTALLGDLNARGKYVYSSTSECLRMMRNKRRHVEEVPEEMKPLLVPESNFCSYFESKYPLLLMRCVQIACQYLCKDDPFYVKYCSAISDMFGPPEVALEDMDFGEEEQQVAEVSSSSSGDTFSLKKQVSTPPSNFRTIMCRNGDKCPFRANEKCTFAHSKEELVTPARRVGSSGLVKSNHRGGSSSSNWRKGKVNANK
eukprot:CAMPEP_0185030820 /NCGR_PEP_ID=MMETSP1103-20130426/17898_1 /TAXON_ID=36769 /ORGANISM="Paraphysomonas bandaiensis, Strain Caron Lab Isolate" /LENGTH=1201 /DNA_ID=CAMNT_0027566089 /DNA_START=102 /DNA_END=3707 /DNA_ORIENTATION=+